MTLKANELRIGNYLNIQESSIHWNGYNFKDTIFEIEVIYPKKVYFKGYVLYEEYGSLKPIPLTDEWLFKFGFEKKYKSYEKCDFTFLQGGFDKLAYKLTIIENTPKYVHQLQNLYFALTGEELTLKNNSNN